MRKEVILAIIIGGLLGLAIAFGIWRASNTFAPQTSPTRSEVTPTPTPNPQTDLVITSPTDGAVVNSEQLTVAGTAKPGITIAIIDDESETVVLADSSGKWSGGVTLAGGANVITVTAFDNDSQTEKQITVVFSTELGGQ